MRWQSVPIITLLALGFACSAMAVGSYTGPCFNENDSMQGVLKTLENCLDKLAYKKPPTASENLQKPCPKENDAFVAAQLKFTQCTLGSSPSPKESPGVPK